MCYRQQNCRQILGKARSFGVVVLIWILLLLFLFPIIWTVLASIKEQVDLFTLPPRFIFKPTFAAYQKILTAERFQTLLLNSLVVSTLSVAIAMLVGTPAAYALSRVEFRGKKDISFWIISARMAPPVVAIVPFLLLFRSLALYDTRTGLVVLYLTFNLPFVVWMMSGYFAQVPYDLDEAAMLDGCDRFQALRHAILPLVMPGFLATATISFIYSWNEFFFAYVLTGRNAQTMPVGISGFLTQHGVHWDEVTATGTLVMLPILIIGLFIQRYFVEGIVEGALAGQ